MTDETAHPPILFKVEEAARVLSIGRTTVYELIASGALRSIRINSSRRITRAALEEFVNALAEDQAT